MDIGLFNNNEYLGVIEPSWDGTRARPNHQIQTQNSSCNCSICSISVQKLESVLTNIDKSRI